MATYQQTPVNRERRTKSHYQPPRRGWPGIAKGVQEGDKQRQAPTNLLGDLPLGENGQDLPQRGAWEWNVKTHSSDIVNGLPQGETLDAVRVGWFGEVWVRVRLNSCRSLAPDSV